MTPEDHAAEAVRLLELAGEYDATPENDIGYVQRALVHATLATIAQPVPSIKRLQEERATLLGQIQGLRAALREVSASRVVQAVPTPAQHAERVQADADRPKPGPPNGGAHR